MREKEKRFREAVDGVTQSFTSVTYAQVAERDYNDSNADSFADLLTRRCAGWSCGLREARVHAKGGPPWRRGDGKVGSTIARLIKGTDPYQPFTEAMFELGVAHRRLRTDPLTHGTYEIVFVTPEKSGDDKLRQREERAKLRLDMITGCPTASRTHEAAERAHRVARRTGREIRLRRGMAGGVCSRRSQPGH